MKFIKEDKEIVAYLLKKPTYNSMMTLKSIEKISPTAAVQVRLGVPSYMEVGSGRRRAE